MHEKLKNHDKNNDLRRKRDELTSLKSSDFIPKDKVWVPETDEQEGMGCPPEGVGVYETVAGGEVTVGCA